MVIRLGHNAEPYNVAQLEFEHAIADLMMCTNMRCAGVQCHEVLKSSRAKEFLHSHFSNSFDPSKLTRMGFQPLPLVCAGQDLETMQTMHNSRAHQLVMVVKLGSSGTHLHHNVPCIVHTGMSIALSPTQQYSRPNQNHGTGHMDIESIARGQRRIFVNHGTGHINNTLLIPPSA